MAMIPGEEWDAESWAQFLNARGIDWWTLDTAARYDLTQEFNRQRPMPRDYEE